MTPEPPPEHALAVPRLSEAFFATLCETAPIGIFQADAEGRATYLNPVWSEVTGRPTSDGLGLGWMETIHEDDRGWVAADWQQAVAGALAIAREFRSVHRDGRVLWVRVMANPVLDHNGKFVGHTGTFENITEQRELETRLRQQSVRLVEADRRKDRFLAILGHELRNPVAAMAMAAEALSRFLANAPEKLAMVDVIRRQSQHASRLLDDLLDVSRIAYGKIELRKQRIDLVEQLRGILSDRQGQFDARQIQLQLELPPEPVRLEADPVRIAQVFANLLNNAAKFTDPGGTISIAVRLLDDRRRVAVEVRDTGIGIEPEALATIFGRFDQGGCQERRGGGLGLGLALAKGLVELHGGTIEAESEGLGKGACFRVSLPLAEVPRPAERSADLATNARRPLRILIIEDSADVVASLEFLLKMSGHELSIAATGQQGIEAARRFRPHVVLCDIGLPDMDGYAVARHLRSDPATASVYLIAVSGYNTEEDQRRSIEAGFDLHLNKPEGFVGLDERLRRLPIAGR